MNESAVLITAWISSAIVLATLIWVFGRLKIEQQKTLQKLLEQEGDLKPELRHLFGPQDQARNDFRRGLLLVVVGIALVGGLSWVGGIGWIFGFMPMAVGLVYLVFWLRNDNRG